MAFAIKAAIADPEAPSFTFTAQKTMYGGKHIAAGDPVFLFASEIEGSCGLVARGVVTVAAPVAKRPGIARQTPRASVNVERTASARRKSRTAGAQAVHRWGRRSARNRAQLQALPPDYQQDHRHF
jgi:hypothetical protein